MPYPSSKFVVFNIPSTNLERFLNQLELMATGAYEIVAIDPKGHYSERVAVRLTIREEEPVFNESEIKRKLGYT